MGSPAATLKAAQETALRASAALAAAMGGTVRVYTDVPPNAPLPYVVLSELQVIPDTSGCADEAEIHAIVQLWSRPAGARDKGAQAYAMGSAIFEALNAALTLEGFEVVEWECGSELYSTDPDASTHGRLEFRYLTTEIVA